MSPRVLQPRSSKAAAVFSGSPLYSNRLGDSNQTSPSSPAGSSVPSAPTMCTAPSSDRPTEPGWASHSSGPMAQKPSPSLPE